MRSARGRGEPEMHAPKERLYLVGDEWDFAWTVGEIKKVKELYEAGLHLADIARGVNRPPWGTMMLLVDMGDRGLIRERPGFLWGKR